MIGQGAIFKSARSAQKTEVVLCAVFCIICAAITAFHWKYVFNWISGPFTFDEALAQHPGAREFVRAEGASLSTGLIQQTTTRRFHGLWKSTHTSATVDMMLVNRRYLLVKRGAWAKGETVEGRLAPIPDDLRTKLGKVMEKHESIYPWLLDAEEPYRRSFNFFVMLAVLLLPVFTIALIGAYWKSRDVGKHAELKRLRKHGALLAIVSQIESEMIALGEKGSFGPLCITPSWVVVLEPSLHIFRVEDLVGIGVLATRKKSATYYYLIIWDKDRISETSVHVSAAEGVVAIMGVGARLSWLLVKDVTDFRRRWAKDRNACIAEVRSRKAEIGA
jgi:hypothetical protein